jgi:hypothetical protein
MKSQRLKAGIPVLFLIVLFMPCSAFPFDGPFQVKNQFPVFFPMNQPYLEQAETESSFSLSLSHSSVFVVKESASWKANLDLEMTELNMRFRKDMPGLFELGLDLPVVRAIDGIMDRPLAWYHRTFGFGDYDRHTRPRNDFLYSVGKNGAPLIQGENGRTGFGDVRLTLKRKLIETGPVVSTLVSLELPSGNARLGYGNGSPDAGIALLLDKDIGNTMRLYANLGVVSPGELKALQTIGLRTFYYGGAGVEYLHRPNLGLIAQFIVETSPYPETGISEIDTPGVLLALGGRFSTDSGCFEFSLSEDPNTSAAPDFILNLTYKYRFR